MNILTQKYSFFRRKFMVVYCFGQKFDAKVRSCIIIYKCVYLKKCHFRKLQNFCFHFATFKRYGCPVKTRFSHKTPSKQGVFTLFFY